MLVEESYQSHIDHFAGHLTDERLRRQAESWLRDDTVDFWRHRRLLALIHPFLEDSPGTSWLTVGDGRWGREARYILDRGGQALPTDLSETLLLEAKRRGFIPEYRIENAEGLTFQDDAFDFVLCKESYHHFPRPPMAVYEMLRVARRAVILMEPQDEYPARLLTKLKVLVKRSTGRRIDRRYNSFEESGNYVYTVSKRDLEKLALGVGLPAVAFREMNTYYVDGVEYQEVSGRPTSLRWIQFMIALQDFLTRLRLVRSGILTAVLFKDEFPDSLRSRLDAAGYRIWPLPRNPYLSR